MPRVWDGAHGKGGRMRRRLFTLVSALSLVLCVATCVLWARSVGHVEYVFWSSPGHMAEMKNPDGVLGLILTRDSLLYPIWSSASGPYGWAFERPPMANRDRSSLSTESFNRWGFGFHWVKTRLGGAWRFGGRRLLILYLPFWVPVLLTAIMPACWATKAFRHSRRKHFGLCPTCGYDLRATPDRCPECGMERKGQRVAT
jgi:4-amino-4-deoxy-L-arabinose transferase-like glycosyltransferase